MNSWDHLPNAIHIDRVLESCKNNKLLWKRASETSRSHADEWKIAERTINGAPNSKIYSELRVILRNIFTGKYDPSDLGAADAVMALIAYDDCAYMLDSDPGELEILAKFGNSKACLLLPACIVLNKSIDK